MKSILAKFLIAALTYTLFFVAYTSSELFNRRYIMSEIKDYNTNLVTWVPSYLSRSKSLQLN
jgi:hypothetical protein